MRKIITLLLVILLVGGLCGCRKEEDNTSSITSSAETKSTQSDDTSEKSEETNSNESEASNSSETPTQSTTTDSSKKQNGASSTRTSTQSSTIPHREDPVPIPQSKDWTSLEGNWIFYTSEMPRPYPADYYVINFNIYNGDRVSISKGWYLLPENTEFEVTKNPSLEINGKTYYWSKGHDGYNGTFFITIGKEDRPVLELKCYDDLGWYFLADELEFKRLDNDTLQYIGPDYEEFQLRNGDIFKRY